MSNRFGPRTRLLGTALASPVARWMQKTLIKSIQRGTITITSGNTSNTATITAVNVNNSRLNYLGLTQAEASTSWTKGLARVALTDGTTVTATVTETAADAVISFEVVEYLPGVIRSVQRDTITIAGATSNTATITAVTLAKSELSSLGWTTGAVAAGDPPTDVATKLVFTNNTTITANKIDGPPDPQGTTVSGFQVIEYY